MEQARYYAEVVTNRLAIKGQSSLTYHSDVDLKIGSIVRIPLGKKTVNGVVTKIVSKPRYATKSIEAVLYPSALPDHLLRLAEWMSLYYATPLPQVIQTMLPVGLHTKRRETPTLPISESPLIEYSKTPDQEKALKTLVKNPGKTVLLHGVTGSGKTLIYVERARQLQKTGQGSIVLVPEIGLTPQIVSAFKSLGDEVFVVHSHQTAGQRHRTWETILNAKAPVVIGPRSALFAPISNLGLIVVDEEHESSYKQDMSPKYHAVTVASKLSQLCGAQLVLGSATPRVEDRYLADARNVPIVKIDQAVKSQGEATAKVEIIDLKDSSVFGAKSRVLSRVMIGHIDEVLDRNKQALIFHNRRGTATSVICASCGWVAECQSCYVPMTFHRDFNQLVCHICNKRSQAPMACPDCSQPELIYRGLGTKQIVDECAKIWPGAKIARFDSDLETKDQLEERFLELHRGDVDIIVGTQMVAKGLDLPNLDYVGVVLADATLYLPDYSANERAFQLLYQVVGRTGRHAHGRADIQSYTPSHPSIQAALTRDYESFYQAELADRKLAGYPPFRFLLSLTVERAKRDTALKAASALAQTLAQKYPSVKILGPSPAFRERTNNGYRWQLVVKSAKRNILTDIVSQDLPDRWQFELDPINLL